MNEITFLSSMDVKTLIPQINSNYNDDKIRRHILQVQYITLKPVLGDLFNVIHDQIANNTLSEANRYLLTQYTSQIIAILTYRRLVIYDPVSIEESGARVKTSDYSEPADIKHKSLLISALQDDADFWLREMQRYICNNLLSYPNYGCSNTTINKQRHITDFNCGFIS